MVSFNLNNKKKRTLYIILNYIFTVTVLQLNVDGSKICYQCDQKNPAPWWKFWSKLTRCNGIPFEKYTTKTSKAFGAGVLTCYTVIFLI